MTTPALIARPQPSPLPRVLIVEAAAGAAWQNWIEHRVLEMQAPGSPAWRLSCDFDFGGPWSGAKDLFESLLPEIQARGADLIERHADELVSILPRLRRSLAFRNPTLTDLAPPRERTRNYAGDRALRIVHGLIDLIDSWKTSNGSETPWIISCDSYGQSGVMAGHFFRELMRRRGERLNIYLLLAVRPGQAEQVRAAFHPSLSTEVITLDLPASAPVMLNPDAATRQAAELEAQIGENPIETLAALPELIRLWRAAGRADKVLEYRYFALDAYNNQGLYSDAIRYGEGLTQLAAEIEPQNKLLRWGIILKLLNSYIPIEDVKSGLELAHGEAAEFSERERPYWRAQLCYLTAILYSRYSKPRDFARGEEYLDRGLVFIEQDPALSEPDRHFSSVFNRNGLAMIRNFQGRRHEALDICRQGISRLTAHLAGDQHRLHRSVLIYNIAQVYAALGSTEEGIRHYSTAMGMDPNYSEYYNERGSIFLKIGRLEEACADYKKAIELSPPYFEVFTNLGQCYRRMGAMEQAVEAYSRALDLEPNQLLAWLGRAKANEELGHRAAAIADYSAALNQDPAQWEAVASRGVLYYEAGDLPASLADFDRAIELKPDEPDLHQNRALVLAGTGRHHEAARGLESALRLTSADAERLNLQSLLQQELELEKAS